VFIVVVCVERTVAWSGPVSQTSSVTPVTRTDILLRALTRFVLIDMM